MQTVIDITPMVSRQCRATPVARCNDNDCFSYRKNVADEVKAKKAPYFVLIKDDCFLGVFGALSGPIRISKWRAQLASSGVQTEWIG